VCALDDGHRSEVNTLAATFGCGYIRRPDRPRHAKAENLNHALRLITGDFVKNEQALFFRTLQAGCDTHNSAFFVGSGGLRRREPLAEPPMEFEMHFDVDRALIEAESSVKTLRLAQHAAPLHS